MNTPYVSRDIKSRICKSLFASICILFFLSLGSFSSSVAQDTADSDILKDKDFTEKVAPVYRGFIDRLTARRKQYEDKLVELKWPTMLDAEQLAKDPKAVETRKIMNSVMDEFMKYLNESMVFFEETVAGLRALDIEQEMKDGFLSNLAADFEHWRKFREDEINRISQYDMIVGMLEAPENKWRIENKIVVFENEETTRSFYQILQNSFKEE